MAYLLDSNIAIHMLDGDNEAVLDGVAALDGPLQLSVVSQVEIAGGLSKADDPGRRHRFALLSRQVEILPFGGPEAKAYDDIVASCGFSRRKVLDRMIAAHAIVQGSVLVTRNGDDFRDIPGLKLLEL